MIISRKMKIGKLLLLALAFSAASCTLFINQQTPKGYVRYAVSLLDRDALYADRTEWKEKRAEVLAASVEDMDAAHRLIQEAAAVAGGKHSFIMAPVSDSLYIHTILDFLQAHQDARGVIVDLRGNTGGNMYPMITAVSPLLPDGIVFKFQSRKQTTPVWLDYVMESCQIPAGSVAKFPASTPVAVLTDDHTGSSGEATLICFRGLDNVRTFGAPTAGYASGNMSYTLSDGYLFAITRSADVARTGEVFCEDPILPDVPTETPLADAIAWITSL